MYVNLLGHPVDPNAGLNPWFVALQTGAREEDVIANIVASLENFQKAAPHWNVPIAAASSTGASDGSSSAVSGTRPGFSTARRLLQALVVTMPNARTAVASRWNTGMERATR